MNNKESQPNPNELEQAAANDESQTNQAEQETATEEVQLHDDEKQQTTVVEPSADAAEKTTAKGGSSVVWMAISAVLAILLIIVLIKPPFGGESSKAIASVNGVAISKDKLYEELVAQGGQVTMENLITEELIIQAAKKANVTVTDEEVQKEIQLIIDSVGSEEQFDMLLSQYSMTRESLSESKYYDILIRKVLEPQTTVTEDDVKAYYDENSQSLGTPAKVRAAHILVATKEEADQVYEDLQNGADFATLVQERSLDTGSLATDGDLDFFAASDMEQNFSNAAFQMKVGEISQPVESSYGYGFHIIKKTDEQAAVTPTFEEKKEEIRLLLVTEQVSGLSAEWLETLRSEATITNTLEETSEGTVE